MGSQDNIDILTQGTVYQLNENIEGSKYRGDFIGFQYGDVTSADLCVVRVSDGSRYNEDLLPSFNNKTVQVPGSNQTYYFGAEDTERPYTMEIAFDEIDEEHFRKLVKVFSGPKPKRLTLDERPYKYYMAKVNSAPQFKYICFDVIKKMDDNTEKIVRVYKGEGTINFTYYYPYGKSWARYLNELQDVNRDGYYTNMAQWEVSSGMKEEQGDYDIINGGNITVYNAGDIEANWYLKMPFDTQGKIINTILTLQKDDVDEVLEWSEMVRKSERETGVRLNSSNNLLEGYIETNGKLILSGNIYNEYIIKGHFFTLPLGESNLQNSPSGSTIDYAHIYY